MKVVDYEKGSLIFQRVFSLMMSRKGEVVAWQVNAASGERQVCYGRLSSVQAPTKTLNFSFHEGNLEAWHVDVPLYFYSEEGQAIFKSKLNDLPQKNLSVNFPAQIHFLEEPDIHQLKSSIGFDLSPTWKTKRMSEGPDDVSSDLLIVRSMKDRSTHDLDILNDEMGPITLEEEEKKFAGMRESPRARPKEQKMAKIGSTPERNFMELKLFDLSRGGMAFISTTPDYYPKESLVYVWGFDGRELDDALVGKVMSVRPLDDNPGEFKVGVKFVDGN